MKKDILVKIDLSSSYGDRVFDTYDANDSLLTIPYNNEYNYGGSLILKPRVTKTLVSVRDDPPGKEYVLKITSKKDKIEALIVLTTTNPRISNLLLLAEAYEEERCFANTFYIYKRIMSKDLQMDKAYWNQFCSRHWQEFSVANNVHR